MTALLLTLWHRRWGIAYCLAWVAAVYAIATSLGCVIRDDFAGTGRKVVAHSVYREGFYDEGGPIVLRLYRVGETGGPVGLEREAVR